MTRFESDLASAVTAEILRPRPPVERNYRYAMFSARLWTGIVLILALALGLFAQEPRYKFSTTVFGEPIYTFGTTVATLAGFRGEIYYIDPGSRKLPDFSKLKPVGEIYTPYLCVPPRSFDEGFPGVTQRFEWFAIDYTGRFWVSNPGTHRFALASDDGSILYIDGRKVIGNDKVHPVLERTGSVKLKAGRMTSAFHTSRIPGLKSLSSSA